MTCETVKIKNDRQESGYVIINKSDFNPDEHQLFGVEDEPKRGRPAKKE
jgi:hypothetical protein